MALTLLKTSTVQAHPVYAALVDTWRTLYDVFTGGGGFLDGTYLIAHPREWVDHDAPEPRVPSKKLLARRRLARYENIAAMLIDAKHGALFRRAPTRTVMAESARDKLSAWWADVDGRGTHIDDFMAAAWRQAACFGHMVILADEHPDAPGPRLLLYSPIDCPDWLEDSDGRLTAVKLLESPGREAFSDPAITEAIPWVREVNATDWRLTAGKSSRSGPHPFGVLPIVTLFAARRPITGWPGLSVLHDPKLFIDLFNLTSEIREILRNQTFGILNVPLGTGDDAVSVESARAMLSGTTGTDQILFTPAAATYLQPSPDNVKVYMEERTTLLRTIFRLSAVPWQADSRDAEAEGSLRLKREDMNQQLASYADELEQAEYALVDLFYRQQYGADVGPRKMAADQISLRYPDDFNVASVSSVLEDAHAALSLAWPPAVTAEIQKRTLDRVLPDLPAAQKTALVESIDKAATQAALSSRERFADTLSAFRDQPN